MQRSVRRPRAADLGPDLVPLREIALCFQAAGKRAWVVGGAVRDLALGARPVDCDLASDALPEDVERLFEHTAAVGREFGTVLILWEGREVQHTTFRSESGYSDQRHPDRVSLGAGLLADARRRDFTCNALYLDPLADVFADPEGGLADLSAGRLRAVGDAAERFREDGLRLLRLARFAARLELDVDPETLAAARREGPALAGVSGERIVGELERIFGGPRSARAVALLLEANLLGRCLAVDWVERPAEARRRQAWLDHLDREAGPEGPGLESGLALLLAPEEGSAAAAARAEAALAGLPLARATRRGVLARWRLAAELEALLAAGGASRAQRVRLVREAEWTATAALVRARLLAEGCDLASLDELEAFAASLGPDESAPAALLGAQDFRAAGISPGPRYGALLEELEALQLDQRLTTPDEARAWLARRAAET
jgi:tRNA nucleotidyltransferase/poly(A) polymerase